VDLTFSDDAVREIARDAERVNRALENIGARACTRSSSGSSKTSRSRDRKTRAAPSRLEWRTSAPRSPTWSATRTCPVTSFRRRLPGRAALVALLFPLAAACGKKGDPQPPLPRGPAAIRDLAVEQEGSDAVLTFTYPDRLMNGDPLRDVASLEIYRVVDPSPALVTTRPPAPRGPAPA